MEKTIENLKTDNWYYSQMFFRGASDYGSGYCVVFAKTPAEAKELSKEYAKKTWNKEVEVHLYLKNYKIEAKKLINAGAYIVG